MNKIIIIIPTFNERKNISKLIPEIIENYPNVDVLVVDDNSPDGTSEVVREMSLRDKRIKLIVRKGKMGLGTAYVEGFKYMLKNGYELAIQMDADFSHDPKEIGQFLSAVKDYDVVIGSRYISGVNVINWPMRRLLLSYFANYYTRIITGMPLKDSTGGYKCFRREVLQSINLDSIHSNGYAFQIEMNFKAYKKNFKLKEIPIIFTERVDGKSKMSKRIVWEAVFRVWELRIKSILGLL